MITVAASSKHDPESISEFARVKDAESPHPDLTSLPHPDLTSLPRPDLTSLPHPDLTKSNVAMPSNKTEKQSELPLLPVIRVPKGATQDGLEKAYYRSVKAQEHGKMKFLAPGEIAEAAGGYLQHDLG
jgi:hypothetical protein